MCLRLVLKDEKKDYHLTIEVTLFGASSLTSGFVVFRDFVLFYICVGTFADFYFTGI